jgi:hypothetical protein
MNHNNWDHHNLGGFPMSRIILASVVVVGLAVAAPAAFAQTGPVGGGQGGNGNGAMMQPGIGSRMTPEALDQYLKQQGHQSKINKLNNGDVLVMAEIQKDGWKFSVEFLFGRKGEVIDVTVPLVPVSQISSPQAMALLKFSYEKAPLHFSLRPGDNVLTLELGMFGAATVSSQQLPMLIETATRSARETYDLWNPAKWNGSGVAQK